MKEPAELNKHHRAEALKERVYVTFTALAVVLALQSHLEETLTAGQAAVTLAITVIGTLVAVFVADLISHLAVHEKTPTRQELLRMAQVSFGAFAAVVLPLIFIGLAGLGWWGITTALQAATATLVLTLVLIGYLAIRRIHMAWWKRLTAVAAEFLLGLAVIGLELIAHG